jgi:SNF2-related domain/SNF2 Helicase protein/Helicase conserved C-terminal domain
MGQQTMETQLDQTSFEALVASEVDGQIAADDLSALAAQPQRWAATLHHMLDEIEDMLEGVARSDRYERDQALADLSDERAAVAAALRRVTGEDLELPDPAGLADGDEAAATAAGEGAAELVQAPALQASWAPGEVVLWAGNPSATPAEREDLQRLIDEAGGSAIEWEKHKGAPLPSGDRAPAVSAPVTAALGWLVGVGAGQLALDAAPSVRWLGEVAAWATDLVAQGRMVPTLRRGGAAAARGRQRSGSYAVQWIAAVVERERIRELSARMPGPVRAFDPATGPERMCRTILNAAVDAVCRAGAARLVTAATPPVARSRRDVAEAVLAGLAGEPFAAAHGPANEVADDLRRWAAPVVGDGDVGLIVRLDPPEADGGWLLTVDATGLERHPLPIEQAVSTSGAKAQRVEAQLRRLERLLPALSRTGRRGHVVLGVDEAWDLMTRTGRVLQSVGFDVRVPTASWTRPSPRLRLDAAGSTGPAKVGPNQLSKVRWSVLFDDVELDAAAIARLTAQARPLVQAKGRWVELDHADLEAAAKALAEQGAATELTGAAILRHAVGLEETALAGPAIVTGSGWAVDLVRGASDEPPAPLGPPDGFVGKLRSYQAEARGWLAFLDRVGLGGCLAMDMGLGKTPVMLAHLLDTRGHGPVLVIAPPAVLGNWAAEAKRFTPDLRVQVHHGAARAEAQEVAAVAGEADVVLTTYGTAVRDVEALATVDWHRVVLDEAQAIKNPASEVARELRRIPGGSRLALTGTPIENGLGDLWSILDYTNPGLVGPRPAFIQQLSTPRNGSGAPGEAALRALNGLLVFRRTKAEPEIAAELPDKIDELDHCGMTSEQIGLYQAVLDNLLGVNLGTEDRRTRTGHVLAAITALKQICDHPAAYLDDDRGPLEGRSGKLARLDELVDNVFAAGERVLVFTHFARWGERLAEHLTKRTGIPVACYHGGLTRGTRDRLVREFQEGTGPGALVLSIKAGGSGLNLTAANHVVLYDRWWNPAVEDQARDRAWRIGQANTVISHRLVCPGTVDEQVEEVVAGKRRIADLVLPASSSVGDLTADQLRQALGLRPEALVDETSADTLAHGQADTADKAKKDDKEAAA